MGGQGSTRWLFHSNKILVEDCFKMTICTFKSDLKPGNSGSLTWSQGGSVIGSISFQVMGDEKPTAILLLYTINNSRTSEKRDLNYHVPLQTTRTSWGSLRFWFTCPLSVNGLPCERRVGALYLPPGGRYFGCRYCYDLTYRSSQESKIWDGFYKQMAVMMRDRYPGAVGADIQYLLEERGKPPEGFFHRMMTDDWSGYSDPYANYLTADELLNQTGLTSVDLSHLESALLLLPDHDGKYRPKLVGWGRKLAYLLGQGWKIDEIKRWTKGRWLAPDPRQWPPERERWVW